jgi:hypothetical protein
MAPPLPKTMRWQQAIGVALAVVGLLVWGGLATKIEIEMKTSLVMLVSK